MASPATDWKEIIAADEAERHAGRQPDPCGPLPRRLAAAIRLLRFLCHVLGIARAGVRSGAVRLHLFRCGNAQQLEAVCEHLFHRRTEIEAAGARGVVVANVPDYCVEEVSDHAVALLLDWARGVTAFDRSVKTGAWSPSEARLRRARATWRHVGSTSCRAIARPWETRATSPLIACETAS